MTAFEYLFGVKEPTKKEFNEAVQFLEFILGGEATICTCTDANRIMTLKQALFWDRGWSLKNGCTDAFFTPNGLKRRSKIRNSANVEKLNTLYMDLDLGDRYTTPESALEDVNACLNAYGLECSYVINSGSQSGLHVYITFSSPMIANEKTVTLWRKLQNGLAEILKDFNVDEKVVSDCSRVLRVPYSVNTKHNRMVRIVESKRKKFSIETLKKILIGKEDATEKQLDLISAIENETGMTFPDKYKATKENADKTIKNNLHLIHAEYILKPVTAKQEKFIAFICNNSDLDYNAIMSDIKNSKEASEFIKNNKYVVENKRSKATSIYTGYVNYSDRANREGYYASCVERFVEDNPENTYAREVLLFMYRLSVCHATGDPEIALEKMLILNRVFAEPFDEAVITKATASAEKYFYEKPGKYYTPENYQSKVCGMDSDVNILKYFVRPKRSRKAHKDASEYKRQYYRAKLINDGKRPYSEVLNERYEYIRNYISSNVEYNRAELIKELSALFNVSVRTARRYVETVEEIIKGEECVEAELMEIYEATGTDTVEVKSDKIYNGQFLDNNTIKIYSYARGRGKIESARVLNISQNTIDLTGNAGRSLDCIESLGNIVPSLIMSG